MERLSDKAITLINELHTERLDYESEYIPLINAANLLTDYEDLCDIDHLREIMKAEKDGRIIVLPCKDWLNIVFRKQTLYWGIDTGYPGQPVREINIDDTEHFTWHDRWKTFCLKGTDENGLTWEFSPEDIGKTVFLTREEAETASRGEEHED